LPLAFVPGVIAKKNTDVDLLGNLPPSSTFPVQFNSNLTNVNYSKSSEIFILLDTIAEVVAASPFFRRDFPADGDLAIRAGTAKN
jgi:hypothetical protein